MKNDIRLHVSTRGSHLKLGLFSVTDVKEKAVPAEESHGPPSLVCALHQAFSATASGSASAFQAILNIPDMPAAGRTKSFCSGFDLRWLDVFEESSGRRFHEERTETFLEEHAVKTPQRRIRRGRPGPAWHTSALPTTREVVCTLSM